MEKIMFLEHLLSSEFSFKENLSNNERIPSPFLPMHAFLHFDVMLSYFSTTQKEYEIVLKSHSYISTDNPKA